MPNLLHDAQQTGHGELVVAPPCVNCNVKTVVTTGHKNVGGVNRNMKRKKSVLKRRKFGVKSKKAQKSSNVVFIQSGSETIDKDRCNNFPVF